MELTRDGLTLRPTKVSDLSFVLAAECSEDNRDYVSQQTFEEHSALTDDPDVLHLIIEEGSNPVGYTIIAGLTKQSRSIELRRIVITEKGRGLGRKAIRLCKELAFEHLNAHRLWLDVVHYNTRAQHLYASEGFVREGVLRDCDFYQGQFNSLVIMSILEDEARSFDTRQAFR